MRHHFDRGQKLYGEKRYAEAACAFLAAYDARPSASLLYDAAVCYEKDSRAREALAYYTSYLAKQPMAKDRADTESRIRVLEEAVRSLGGP
jgi:tetratricopeptide (TPR) repeat protein